MAEIAQYHPIIVITVIIVMSPLAFSSNSSIKGTPVFFSHFFAYSCQPTAFDFFTATELWHCLALDGDEIDALCRCLDAPNVSQLACDF